MVALGFLLLVFGIVGSIFYGQYKQYKALLAEKEELVQELKEVEGENEKLQGDVNFSNTQEFIEYMARQLLGWVKPGEVKYVNQGD